MQIAVKHNFPDLLRHVIRLCQEWKASELVTEDHASGTQLRQTLRSEDHPGVPWPRKITPEADKVSRVAGVSSIIEAGQLLLPEEAPWLAEFKGELLAFPSSKYDDQVDALSQLLSWNRKRQMFDRDDDMVYPPRYGHIMVVSS